MHFESCVSPRAEKRYQLVVMVPEGKITLGKIYDNWSAMHEAMIELRTIYAKYGVIHHVGYMEV